MSRVARGWSVVWGLALAGACVGPQDVLEEEGPVEVTSQRLTISGTDVDVSHLPGQEGEVNIDVNPGDPTNMVIAGHTPGFTALDTFFTTNSGRTWTLVPLGPAQDGLAAGTRFDPAVAFDTHGNVYVVYGVTTGGTTTLL